MSLSSHRLKKSLESSRQSESSHPNPNSQANKPAYSNPPISHWKHGNPIRTWAYRDRDGKYCGEMCEFETTDKKGRTRTRLRYLRQGPSGRAWSKPPMSAPLYGVERLNVPQDARIVVCGNEASAEAASKLMPNRVVVTSMGGIQYLSHTDWTPLKDCRVRIWPTQGQAGMTYAREVARLAWEAGATSVRILDLASLDLPEHWDATHAVAEGWTVQKFKDAGTKWLASPKPAISKGPSTSQKKTLQAGVSSATDFIGRKYATFGLGGSVKEKGVAKSQSRRLVQFDAKLTTSLEALIAGLGLDRDAIMNGSVTVPALTQASSSNEEPTRSDRKQGLETITDDDGCSDGITTLSDDRSDIQTQSEKPPVEDALTVDPLVDDRQVDQVIEQPIIPDPPKPSDLLGDVPLHDLATASFELLRFLIDSILPRGQTTVLASLDRSNQMLALVMAAHVATGRAWGSLAAEKGRVLYVLLEDPGDLVKQLIRGVCEHYNLPMEMVAAYLHIVDGREAAPLVRACTDAQGERVLSLTPAYTELLRRAADMDLVVIDAASSAFGGDETDYIQVRSIIRHLDAMVTPHNGAVLLLTRGSQASAPRWSNGMGLTAWDQAVRSRLWLIEQTNRLELHSETDYPSRQRNPPIRLSWSAQCVLTPDVTALVSAQALDHQKQSDEAIVLECLKRAIDEDELVPKATSGTSKSWDVLKDYGLSPELLKDKKRVYSALNRLNDQGVIGIDNRLMSNRQFRDFWVLIETQTDIMQNQL